MSSKVSSRSNSKSFKKTKKNKFNNIPSPVLRKRFYSALDGDIHRDYIIVLYKFGILLEQKLRNTEFKNGRYKFTLITDVSGYCMEFFGGALFYLLYLEADKMGLFKPEDNEVLQNFLKFKTIDIDTSINFKITPSIDEFKQSTKDNIIKKFSKQYHALVVSSFHEILESNEEISSFFSFLATKRNFKGFDFIKGENIIPHLGPGGICSISINVKTEDLLELRPQINTCVGSEDNCDHIFEILTVNESRMSNVQLFNLSLVDEFMGRNIILLCLQNIDRFYRDVRNEGFTEVDKGSVMVGVKNILKKEPTFKTKYMQGFYRVELIFIIISRLLARKSPKFNNLKKVLLPTKEVIIQVHNTISRNSIILSMMPVRKRVALEKDFRKIRFTDDNIETLENSHYILNTLIDFWVTIHQEILSNFKKEPHDLIKYSLPPSYSSSNNEDNKLYLKVGKELDINFESPGWENKITRDQIVLLMDRLKIKRVPVIPSTIKSLLKRIKNKLNLT